MKTLVFAIGILGLVLSMSPADAQTKKAKSPLDLYSQVLPVNDRAVVSNPLKDALKPKLPVGDKLKVPEPYLSITDFKITYYTSSSGESRMRFDGSYHNHNRTEVASKIGAHWAFRATNGSGEWGRFKYNIKDGGFLFHIKPNKGGTVSLDIAVEDSHITKYRFSMEPSVEGSKEIVVTPGKRR